MPTTITLVGKELEQLASLSWGETCRLVVVQVRGPDNKVGLPAVVRDEGERAVIYYPPPGRKGELTDDALIQSAQRREFIGSGAETYKTIRRDDGAKRMACIRHE